MEFAWSVFGFIIAVSLLVTVHEFGHFWVARKLGFKVLRFSVGFGSPLLKKTGRAPDHTEYVVASIPLGGYVRMLDERDGSVPVADLPRAFGRRPPWQRILVLLAGPAANILFAIVVLWGMFALTEVPRVRAVVEEVRVGSPAATAGLLAGDEIRQINGESIADQPDAALALLDAVSDEGEANMRVRGRDGGERSVTLSISDAEERHKLTEPNQLFRGLGFEFWSVKVPPVLGKVEADGPADKAGLREGDLIIALDGKPISTFNEFRSYVNARPGEQVLVTARRDGSEFTRRVEIVSATVEGKPIGRLMINGPEDIEAFIPAYMKIPGKLGPVESLGAAVNKSWQMTVAQAKFFVRMLTGHVSTKNISGFISIARYSGDAVRAGANSFLMLLVMLSLSLGFLNLLPIPILDGGQIVFQVAEWAKGGPLSERTYMVGQQAGLALLVLLMGVALFNDLTGLLGAHT